jgi:hypothetical protein
MVVYIYLFPWTHRMNSIDGLFWCRGRFDFQRCGFAVRVL